MEACRKRQHSEAVAKFTGLQKCCAHCGLLLPYEKRSNSFCSRSCSASHANTSNPKRKRKERFCKDCGKSFVFVGTQRTKFCPGCQQRRKKAKENLKHMTLAECSSRPSVANKHPSWRWAYVRVLNRRWNAHLITSCAVCGYSRHVELCHRKAISSFPETATLAEVNAESNNVALCPTHHWEFDHGFLVL